MTRGRKNFFLPLVILSLSFFIHLNAHSYIFKGFFLQNPSELLKNIPPDSSPEKIRELLQKSGFFRSVNLKTENDSIIFSVKEFPLVTKISISGCSVYDDQELSAALGLKKMVQFNSRRFSENLQAFYRKTQGDGYTHWQVKEITVKDDGSVRIGVDEGILREVIVENNLIDPEVVGEFFNPIMGKPFNTRQVKFILEELLFTEAFYTIRSEVDHRDNRVILNIIVEKKILRQIKSIVEYSSPGGFRLFNHLSAVKKHNRLGFLDIDTRYMDKDQSEYFQLQMDHYNYKRHLGKSHFSTKMEFFYTSFMEDDNLFFLVEPSYVFMPVRDLGLTLSIVGGIHKNFNNRGNELIGEARLGLRYRYRSPLNRTEFSAGIDGALSLMHDYKRQTFRFDFTQRFFWGDFNLLGQWNTCSGDELPFNFDFLPFEKVVIFHPDQLFSRNFKLLNGEFLSRPLGKFLRLGALFQVFDNEKTEFGYGLIAHVTIHGIPLRFTAFVQSDRFFISAGSRISL